MDIIIVLEILIIILVIVLLVVLNRFLFNKINTVSNESSIVKWFNQHQPIFLILFIAVFIFSVVASTLYYSTRFLPYPAAKPATGVVPLFYTTTAITGIAFFLTQILLFYFAFRYRKKPNKVASFIPGFLKLELIWTIIPAICFIFLFLWGQILWTKIITKPKGDVLEIEVMGEQFNWLVRYPGRDNKFGKSSFIYINDSNAMGIDSKDLRGQDDFIPLQMHVPKNRTVKLMLRSRDVIHSFYIPYFRTKMDAVPGMITNMYFIPTISTKEMREKLNDPDFNYEVACAELCGRMHFAMKLILVVDEPDEFDVWYRKQKSFLSKSAE